MESRQTGWTHQECHQASEDAVRGAQIGLALPGAIHNQQLVLKKKRLRKYGTETAGSEQAGQGSDEVDERDDIALGKAWKRRNQ